MAERQGHCTQGSRQETHDRRTSRPHDGSHDGNYNRVYGVQSCAMTVEERTCYDLYHKHSIEICGLLIVTCLKVANEKPTNDVCNEIFPLPSHVIPAAHASPCTT